MNGVFLVLVLAPVASLGIYCASTRLGGWMNDPVGPRSSTAARRTTR